MTRDPDHLYAFEVSVPSAPEPIDLVRELREAAGLPSGAMPISPKQAWDEAILHVRGMAEGRCGECIKRERRASHAWW